MFSVLLWIEFNFFYQRIFPFCYPKTEQQFMLMANYNVTSITMGIHPTNILSQNWWNVRLTVCFVATKLHGMNWPWWTINFSSPIQDKSFLSLCLADTLNFHGWWWWHTHSLWSTESERLPIRHWRQMNNNEWMNECGYMMGGEFDQLADDDGTVGSSGLDECRRIGDFISHLSD